MQKRYQVFVSSTFVDLQDERAEVMQALLELDCIPAGMELFPAANDEQWEWIKRIIDDSDYYLVIVAGRYGQTHPETGVSFTEMEYRYAVDSGKPVISFIHEDLGNISLDKSETTKKNQKKLQEFIALCKGRLCKFWSNPADLGAKVSRSITQLIRNNPAPGWIKATMIDEAGLVDLERIQIENEALKRQISVLKSQARFSDVSEVIEDGRVSLTWEMDTKVSGKDKNGRTIWRKAPPRDFCKEVCWREVLDAVFPHLINENFDMSQVRSALSRIGDRYGAQAIAEGERFDGCYSRDSTIAPVRNMLISRGMIEVSGAGSFSESWRLVDGGKEALLKFLSD